MFNAANIFNWHTGYCCDYKYKCLMHTLLNSFIDFKTNI
jgi:hypothetical protein